MATDKQDAEKAASLKEHDGSMASLHEVTTNNVRPACFRSTFQELLFVLTATMAIAMGALLSGSIIVTSSFVGRDLNMSQAQITWIAASSSLTSGAFLLFFGRLADLFGRKSMFVGAFFLFSIFALAAGFAKTGIGLDVLNGVMGVFAAAAVPPAVGILGVAYEKPSRRKNAAFACFSGGNPLGFVFGTIFGGVATQLLGWRANFFLIAIIYFLLTIVGLFTVPKDWTDKEPFTWDTIKRFDIVGTLLTVCGIGMFSAALSLGDTAPQGWQTGYVLALLIVGIVLLVAFVFWELWFPDPIVPMTIWKDRDFSLCIGILMLGFASFTPASFFIALYFQKVWQMSALMTAVHLLPMAVSGIIVNIIAGLILHRVSNKLLMYIGSSSYMVAALLLALNKKNSSYWSFCFPAFAIQVIGADLEFNVANMYVMSSMPPSRQSVAGGIFQTAAKLCMTLGLGVGTAVFNSVQQRPTLAGYWDVDTQPYSAVFWFSVASAGASVCLVPFLKIGTQGGKAKRPGRPDSSSEKSERAKSEAVETKKEDDFGP